MSFQAEGVEVHNEDPFNPIMQLKSLADNSYGVRGEFRFRDSKETITLSAGVAEAALLVLLSLHPSNRLASCEHIRRDPNQLANLLAIALKKYEERILGYYLCEIKAGGVIVKKTRGPRKTRHIGE